MTTTAGVAFRSPDITKTSIDVGLISLIVATYGRSSELEPMLRSMLAQTDNNFELIIVDQNEDDRIVPLLMPLQQGLAFRRLVVGTPGAAAARNAGLAVANGALVGFPDDDCWYEPDVVQRVRSLFFTRPAAVGMVAHWVESDPERQRSPSALSLDAWRRFKGGLAPCFVLFFRTERVRSFGGFCENLGPGRYFGACEEDDLLFTLLEAGYRIDYNPNVHIHHHFRKTSWPQLNWWQCRRALSYGRGTGALQAKHRLPAWVLGRGLIGPVYHALRSDNPICALVLGIFTICGRIEGMVGWWLWGRRQSGRSAASR